jgi:hypothetical protein
VLALFSDYVSANGATPDVALFAPRRLAWLESSYASTNMAALERLGVSVYAPASMPTTLGTGSNEDRIILCNSEEIDLLIAEPQIRLSEDVLSGNLQIRFDVWMYGALLATRQPTSTAVLAGTGLSSTSIVYP